MKICVKLHNSFTSLCLVVKLTSTDLEAEIFFMLSLKSMEGLYLKKINYLMEMLPIRFSFLSWTLLRKFLSKVTKILPLFSFKILISKWFKTLKGINNSVVKLQLLSGKLQHCFFKCLLMFWFFSDPFCKIKHEQVAPGMEGRTCNPLALKSNTTLPAWPSQNNAGCHHIAKGVVFPHDTVELQKQTFIF